VNGEAPANEIDRVLADFRAWLVGARGAEPGPLPPPGPAAPTIDLHTLLGHFIGLRQEVNLQTRATRTQQEQNEKTLARLEQALDALAQAQARGLKAPAQEDGLRPVLTTLIELHDAIALAGREMQRVQENVLPLLEELVAPLEEDGALETNPPPSLAPRRSWWARWFGKGDGSGAERLEQAAAALEAAATRIGRERSSAERLARLAQGRDYCERVSQALASLVTGYTMSLQRIERGLRQAGLEPIETVGQMYDPELMEALEVVTDTGLPSGEVLQEVRRGYLWNGRVFRYAQVRVAKS
jgi:molecular chaperone GrpE